MTTPVKVGIVTTHPIQYYAPWFRVIDSDIHIHLKVYYLWQPAADGKHDPEFQQKINWDIPLLQGYEYDWVKNTSTDPGTHHFNGIHNPDAANQIAQWSPDYVVCLGYNFRTFVDLIFSRTLKSIPFLLRGDSHRLAVNNSISQNIKDMLIRRLFRRFDAALSCGIANQRYFHNLGFQSDQIFFCPHGIDTARFNPKPTPEVSVLREKWGIPKDHKIILFAGKFIDKKRPLDLLQAFQKVNPSQTTLLYIGDGALKKELAASVSKNVVIQPFVNQSQMPNVYRAADLLVLPSLGGFETWGLAVQEALACGTPAIISDHCGCHLDLIQPNQNGLVFEAGSVKSLAECLTEALKPGILEQWSHQPGDVLQRYNYETSLTGLKASMGIK
ncbi:MAG: glycosyltransferase family 4 protein [Verrucomicrobiota bacterium]